MKGVRKVKFGDTASVSNGVSSSGCFPYSDFYLCILDCTILLILLTFSLSLYCL